MKYLMLLGVCSMLVGQHTSADIVRGFDDELEITDIYTDLDDWLEAAPEVTVIDFAEFPSGTQIDDEYADLGVNFTSGFYTINDSSAFLDDWGLDGNNDAIVMEFDQSFNAIGVRFPGDIRFIMYLEGELVGWTESQSCLPSAGCFRGFLLDTPFDEIWVIQDGGEAAIDTLYFSFLPVPAPGALALLGMAALAGRSRRRRPA